MRYVSAYCPNCDKDLRDPANKATRTDDGRGDVTFVCGSCGQSSEWDFSTSRPARCDIVSFSSIPATWASIGGITKITFK